jgi:NitT/TauT family transport system substrate-binding protein
MTHKLRLLVLSLLLSGSLFAASPKPHFTVGWSVYVGWNPWYYLGKSGILKKWADKYGVEIKVQRMDYAPSLDAFVAKSLDACAMTNMEALDMPAAAGIDTTAVIVGDYSNGNDALLTRNGLTIQALPGKSVLLVEKTVSQYLLERAMVLNGMESQIKRVTLINTSDADIVAAFMGDASKPAVVSWKPLVSQIAKIKGVQSVFNSSQIPGEIVDLLVIHTDVLNRPDGSGRNFAKAVTGAWFELAAQMQGTGPGVDKVLKAIADASQDTVESYKEQLSTTKFFFTPQSALALASAPDFKQKMALVKEFCFRHQLLGQNTKSADDVAIRFPDGAVQGKPNRVRLRFDNAYMQAAAQGKL